MNLETIKKISGYLTLIVAFVLGLKQIHEPDLWWMFKTGEWMVQNGQIPTQDVFSYTLKGTDWISVKWLFELIAYGFAYFLGPESISLLQGVVNVIMVALISKTIRYLLELIYDLKIKSSHPLLIFGLLIFLFFSDYRLVGRPEMFSHLLTVTYLFLFIRYQLKPGKYIFWLIPLQIIWVNIHEGFAVGIVLLLVFSFGRLIDSFLTKKKNSKEVKQLLIASLLAVLAVAVNPRGFYMFYHPYFLFSVVGSNHYTSELNSVFYRSSSFFSYKEPYFVVSLFILTSFGILKIFLEEKIHMLTRVSSGYIAVIFAFLYLGATGYRNVIFPIIIILPIGWAILIYHLNKFESSSLWKILRYPLIIAPLVFYIGIVTNSYYELFQPKDRYGLTVYATSNPAGAAEFVKKHNLSNKRCFSDYLTSAYFLWELRPGFESFIDLRDLDIFPHSFFETFFGITTFTNQFQESENKYNYDYAILYTWQYPNLHRYLYNTPDWTPVYADNIAAIYLKNTKENANIIAQYQLDSTNLYGHFNAPFQPLPNAATNGISHLFWPWYTLTPNSIDSSIYASRYFRIAADFDRAEFHAQNAINNNTSAYDGWVELGDMYLEIMAFKKNNEDRTKYINMANEAYANGYKIDKTRPECLFGQGYCALNSGNYAFAIKRFKKGIEIKNNATIHTKIAQCYANMNQTNPNPKNMNNWFKHMETAYQLDPENQLIIASLALAYCEKNECEKSTPLLKKYSRDINTPESAHQTIQRCIKTCLP